MEDDAVARTLEMIRHATAPTPDDGGHHEAAHDLADAMLRRVEARKTYERSMCPHEHAVNDWRLHPLTPNAGIERVAEGDPLE